MVRLLALKRKRDIRRQRWQFYAVLATVALGVMMFVGSWDAYENLLVSYNGTYDRLAFADATVVGGDEAIDAALEGVEGVAVVADRLQANVPLRIGDRVFVGRIVEVPRGEQPEVNALDIVDGEYLSSREGAMAETHLVSYYDLSVGDTVEVLTATGWKALDVAAEVVSPEYLWPARSNAQFFDPPGEFGVLFVDRSLFDEVDPTAIIPQHLVLYEDGADVDEVDDAVEEVADDHGALSVILQKDQPSNKGLHLDLSGFQQMAVAFPVMFLLAAGLAAYTLLTRLVYSQRVQIGTLVANGVSRKEVLLHYLSFGLWLGLVGAGIGVLLGLGLGWEITGEYTKELGIPDTIREFRLFTPLAGLVFGVVTGAVSAWVPARLAVRLRPAEALRGDLKARPGGLSLLERVLPPLRRMPVAWRMVLRGMGRSKRRSLSVVVAIIFAMTLVLSAWGMIDTVQILLDRHFNQVETNDALIVPTVPVDDAFLDEVESVEGVRRAEGVYFMECSVKGPDGTYSTNLLAFDDDTQVHGFTGDSDPLPDSGILVGEGMVEKTGIERGDSVKVTLSTLDVSFETVVEGFVAEPMGSPVYLTKDSLEEAVGHEGVQRPETLLQQPGISVAQVVFEDGADRKQVLDDIRDLDGVASASDTREIYDLIQQYMGLFYLLVGIMLAFGGVMAIALIFNVITVNLAERMGELAIMRANGMSKRRIGFLVFAENMILTAVGILPGLAVGYWAASSLMASYTSDMLSFDLEMYPTTPVLAALSMFLVTAVSLWPGMRAVGRLDIATEVRERSQ